VRIVALRVSEFLCPHPAGRVRRCMKCGEPCWISPDSQRIIAALGAVVECLHCSKKPGVILLVSQDDFWTAVDEARKHRQAKMSRIASN
jgi:hypothetical protein